MAEKIEIVVTVDGAREAERNLGRVQDAASRGSGMMTKGFLTAGAAAGTMLAAVNLVTDAIGAASRAMRGLMSTALSSASDMEQSEIAFTSMLGSAEEAQSLLKDLADFAAKTPFDLSEARTGAQRLIAMGISAEDVTHQLQMIGDAVAAVGGGNEVYERMIFNLGQIKSVGRASMIDLRQFAMAGIPIMDELRKTLGVTGEELNDMISDGKIGLPEVQGALENLTGEGGKFAGMMEKQGLSFRGLIDNMRDSVEIALGTFVRESGLFTILKNAIEDLRVVMTGFFRGVQNEMPGVRDAFQSIDAFGSIAESVGITGNDLESFGESFGETVTNILTDILNFTAGFVEGFGAEVPEILDSFTKLGNSVAGFAGITEEELANVDMSMEDSAEKSKATGKKFGSGLGVAITNISNSLATLVKWLDENKDEFLDFVDAITGAANRLTPVLNTINNLINNANTALDTVRTLNRQSTVSSAEMENWRRIQQGFSGGGIVPHMQTGGIVPGSRFSGDTVPAMLNSGEMVLNRGQQGALFKLLRTLAQQPSQIINVSGNNFAGGNRSTMQQENNFVQLLTSVAR